MKNILLSIIALSAIISCGETSEIEEHGTMSAPLPGIGGAGPVHQSKSCIIESTVSQGSAEITVPIDTPENASLVLLGEENAVIKNSSQKELSGQSYDEPDLKSANLPSTGTTYNLGNLRKGTHSVKLEKLLKSKATIIVAQPKSPLNFELQVYPLSVRSGDTVTIEARLRDDKTPLKADVIAEYGINNTLTLKDDGVTPDRIKGDGVFTAQMTAPDVYSFKKNTIRVKAVGSRYNGTAFARNSSAAILVTRAGTKIGAHAVAADKESITIPVEVSSSFNARIDVLYGIGKNAIAWSRKDMVALKKDSAVTISRQAISLAADKAVIRILNHDTKGLEDEVEIALTPAAPRSVQPNSNDTISEKGLPSNKVLSAKTYGD